MTATKSRRREMKAPRRRKPARRKSKAKKISNIEGVDEVTALQMIDEGLVDLIGLVDTELNEMMSSVTNKLEEARAEVEELVDEYSSVLQRATDKLQSAVSERLEKATEKRDLEAIAAIDAQFNPNSSTVATAGDAIARQRSCPHFRARRRARGRSIQRQGGWVLRNFARGR